MNAAGLSGGSRLKFSTTSHYPVTFLDSLVQGIESDLAIFNFNFRLRTQGRGAQGSRFSNPGNEHRGGKEEGRRYCRLPTLNIKLNLLVVSAGTVGLRVMKQMHDAGESFTNF